MKIIWSPLAIDRIIYRLDEEQISVLTVRHGKQILPAKDLKEK